MDRKLVENYIIITFVTVFLGQIYITPASIGFRLSLAVVGLSLSLLFFKKTSSLLLCTFVGINMFLFRGLVDFLSSDTLTLLVALKMHLPVISFYVSFGMLFSLLEIRSTLHRPIRFIIALWFIDSVSNMLEVSIRTEWSNVPFDKLILSIILMGFVRTLFTYFAYWVSRRFVTQFNHDQKERYFEELVIFTSKLKTELFFLKKSKHDIEDAMERIHNVYLKSEDPETKSNLLTIANDIHEIKKDYKRVIIGMDDTLDKESAVTYMSNIDMANILKENALKIVKEQGKDINISFFNNNVFTTTKYYPLISVINNLIINSIDAIESQGNIDITYAHFKDISLITLTDDGCGIDEEDVELIFDPGYSTKFDKETGSISTGIGLTHVKELLNEYFLGNIEVFTNEEEGTKFKITMSKKLLVEE